MTRLAAIGSSIVRVNNVGWENSPIKHRERLPLQASDTGVYSDSVEAKTTGLWWMSQIYIHVHHILGAGLDATTVYRLVRV